MEIALVPPLPSKIDNDRAQLYLLVQHWGIAVSTEALAFLVVASYTNKDQHKISSTYQICMGGH